MMDNNSIDDDDIPLLIPAEPPAPQQQQITSRIIRPSDCKAHSAKVPVTILTGFLGSGKTTLLRYILNTQHDLRIAVLMNEFSTGGGQFERALNITAQGDTVDTWIDMPNGCVCCSSKGQAVTLIEQMLAQKGAMDHVIIETSGLANPGPIMTSFWVDDALESPIYLDGVITVVDAKNIGTYLLTDSNVAKHDGGALENICEQQQQEERSELSHNKSNDDNRVGGYYEASQQIACADKIVINKTDLISNAGELNTVIAAVQCINTVAQIQCTSFAKIDRLNELLHIDSMRFRSDIAEMTTSSCLEMSRSNGGVPLDHLTTTAHIHTEGGAGTEYVEMEGWLLNEQCIENLMTELLWGEHHENYVILRIKALLCIQGQSVYTALQAVMNTWDFQSTFLTIPIPNSNDTTTTTATTATTATAASATTTILPMNKIVIIGRNLSHCPFRSLLKQYINNTQQHV
jgi:G3E family GTPase